MEEENGSTLVDQYIAQFPDEVRALLEQVRSVVREVAPGAKEKIAYGMPTFYEGQNLVYFAAFTSHVGFYPTPSGIDEFQVELSQYKGAKGSVQFPFGKPLPLDLIRRMTEFRIQKVRALAAEKQAKKSRKP